MSSIHRSKNYREDFPIFAHFEKRETPLIYLDTAACAQMPGVVMDAVRNFWETSRANVHRGMYALSGRATEAYEDARETVRRFINARSTREIIFTRNTTESINLVAYSLGRSILKAGDRILVPRAEHHSNMLPWRMLADERGVFVDTVDMNEEGFLTVEAVERALKPQTKLFVAAQVSNVLGSIHPVREIARLLLTAAFCSLLMRRKAQRISRLT